MPELAHVAIHPSQFPGKVRQELLDSLRARRINHKFHYESVKQAQRWLALNRAFSPSRTDPGCAATYDQSFEAAAARVAASRAHLVGLGCGGGHKDTRLLRLLRDRGKEISYTPVDVSTAMVLEARQTASPVVSPENCSPLVCDLALADDLPAVLDQMRPPVAGVARLVTFFGMIPNFEPRLILPRLSDLLREPDLLLFSANLAPGPKYAVGVKKILPLYDNALTRDWLLTFLIGLGVSASDGELRWVIENDADGGEMLRVAAYFEFTRARQISVEEETFKFANRDRIRLFFSYRHTPALARSLLAQHGLQVLEQWIAQSEEEGVFLCAKTR